MTSETPTSVIIDDSTLEAAEALTSKPDNLEYCLHNLVAFDISAIEEDEDILEFSRNNVQLLIKHIFALPTFKTSDGIVAELPTKEEYKFPRLLPIPEPKPKTRWQIFAAAKGIKKGKRSRRVWDEVMGDWMPRWGMNSVKKNLEKATPVIEVKPGQDPYEDVFETRSNKKQLVKARQRLREFRNKVEAKGQTFPVGMANLSTRKISATAVKPQMEEMMRRAQISTASYGRHDAVARKEIKRPIPMKRKVRNAKKSENVEREKEKGDIVVTPQSMEDEQASYKKSVEKMAIT